MDFKALLAFLAKLKKNNNKEWFDKNRKEYEELRKEWIGFVDETIRGIQKFDGRLAGIEAKNCIFRINRDIRFSKDKSPYKDNFGASMNPGGKNSFNAGYYMHIQPGECFIAGGMYQPEPEKLNAVRQEIDYNLEAFKKIVGHKEFKKHFGALSGEKLSRPPKGYEADNPAIEFIKHKHFLAHCKLDEKLVAGKNFQKELLAGFKAMQPMISFLNEATQ
jgi:uncharacterized protein (TIGR02453 family)